ncbi:MAG: HAD family hydrolase [Smithella sp.]
MNLLLFDFDGVLVESLDVYEKIVTSCLQKISWPLIINREEFLELFNDNFFESLMKRGVDIKEFMAKSGDMLSGVNYEKLKPVSTVLPVIAKLQKDNVLLIISSNDSGTIQDALDYFGYSAYFREVLGSDFMLSKKDKMIYAFDKYQISADNIYYIGDTAGDIIEGKAAGVKTVGVTWGWHSKEKMAAVRPDYLFLQPEDLLQLNYKSIS